MSDQREIRFRKPTAILPFPEPIAYPENWLELTPDEKRGLCK